MERTCLWRGCGIDLQIGNIGNFCCYEHQRLFEREHAEIMRRKRIEQERDQLVLFERETARSGNYPVKRCG